MNEVGMGEAWQVRESQQQNLIEGLIQATYKKEEELDKRAFHLALASVIIEYLKNEQRGIARYMTEKDDLSIFFISIQIAIKNFARTEVEKDALIARFLEKVLATGLSPFHAALTSQEVHEPEKIFHAPSAMSEVPLDESP